jgi:hypothetical protein
MSIARRHRSKLSEAAKSWEEYEQETAALVERHWLMIAAWLNADAGTAVAALRKI